MAEASLAYASIAELAALYKRKAVSPVEVTRAVLDRIEAVDPDLRAYITVLRGPALEAARRAERAIRAGRPLGPLHGVPISLKDLFATRGVLTTNGAKLTAEHVPDRDSTVAARLAAAGAILIGKANLHEFAFGPTGVNPHYGAARNPWDRARVPGGSSSGSAAAVAAGLCHGSMGTDTGGSVRIPAALCGIVGLKPTYGRVSRAGVTTLSWSLDHPGPMTRTVRDAALMLQAIAGYDPADPASSRGRVPRYSRLLGGDLKGVRVGLPTDYFRDLVDPEVEAAVQAAAGVLRGLGARLVEVSLPHFQYAPAISLVILSAEATAYHEPYLRSRPGDYGDDVRERLRLGHVLTATQYLNAQRARACLLDDTRAAFRRVDAILSATAPIAAPALDQTSIQWPARREDVRSALPRLTRPWNLTGLPAISVPCGFAAGGLPVGLQIAGRPFDEPTVLRIAHAYEQATEWHTRRPPV
jgi:aspartyl-tRNA(Asn)/glutamyl-tRNA(Gln) amidotransferase subunit A